MGFAAVFRPGSIVRGRGRLWRVLELADPFLRAESLDGLARATFYLPREGDGLRLEAAPHPPARPGPDPALHRLYLETEHLRTLQADAPFLALQRSRVVPHSFQLVPLLMALENPERVRLLIADDVGLGKTIEAGLVTKELLLRGLARRVLVLTPAHLKEVWQDAFRRFFHLRFAVLDRAYLRTLAPGESPWRKSERLVASIDLAKRKEHKDHVLAEPWDLVIVDEAHLASRVQGKNERHHLVKDLARRVRHLLLVTATPHSGDPRSFLSLIEHLDPDGDLGLLAGEAVVRSRARRHVVQRTRKDVLRWYAREGKKPPFPGRDARPVPVAPSAGERELFAALAEYARFLVARAEHAPTHWLAMHFLRRAASSPLALYRSLENRIQRLKEGALEAAPPPPPGPLLDNPAEDDAGDEAATAYDTAWIDEARAAAELGYLEALAQALKPRRLRPDGKFKRLVGLLSGELSGKKTLLFTRYRDTLEYLEQLLPRHLKNTEVLAIHGGHTEAEREDVLERLARAERAVLVATDVISEGLNLQHHASQVVHYELPWNPNRLEQRNGRVDRFGQPEPVVRVRMLFYEDSLDALVFRRLIEKAARIKEAFGVVPNYFGDEAYIRTVVEGALGEAGFLPKSRQQGLFEAPEEDDEAAARRAREEGFYDQSVFELPDVEQALSRTYDRVGRPEELGSFFARGLAQFGWELVDEGGVLRVRAKGRPLAGFDPPVGARFTFDPWVFDPGVEKLDLAHPAVEALLERLRARAWSGELGARTGVFEAGVPRPVFLYLFRARFAAGRGVLEALYPEAYAGGEPLPLETANRLLTGLLQGRFPPAGAVPEALLEAAHRAAPSGEAGREAVRRRLSAEREAIRRRLARVYGEESPFVRELGELEPLGEPEWLALTVLVGGDR